MVCGGQDSNVVCLNTLVLFIEPSSDLGTAQRDLVGMIQALSTGPFKSRVSSLVEKLERL